MNKDYRYKLNKVLASNMKWPMIVQGANLEDFDNAVVIPANIDSRALGVLNLKDGFKYPTWLVRLNTASKNSNNSILLIDGLDELEKQDQSKFYSILKHKCINGATLPSNSQVVVSVKDINNVDNILRFLCLIYKVA